MDRLELLKQRIDKFNKDRDWDKFHTPVNLAKSIAIEASELLECFQWSDTNYNLEEVQEELADVMNYCIQMSQVLNIDIIEVINNKMNKNEKNISKVKKEPDEVDKSFKELLDHYASFSGKRSGSTRAKQKYRLLCTKGCVVGGEFIKLTPEQIDEYVGNYVNDMEYKKERGDWVPEWRNIDTILNNITDYM